ncbi:MFS general substrate transporter [Coprinopsis marcescibilis]|uniref:MFS general substrate transporter n=1 Tax=Coprinopsis marcescibilis TaxID=230819 RepID=A0A5C3L9U5_COPMA|nr:MFS general substrate transporter [Coprinopsis marcescibilis]
MIPPVASEPDHPSQVAWPLSRNRALDGDRTDTDNGVDTVGGLNSDSPASRTKNGDKRKQFSTWDLITLSISMAGAQIAWTVELGYGTPFLLELGLPAHLTSLVWLAGPLSGLIAQPVIGALSDSSNSKYRRRFWIVCSTIALVVSTLVLAYCEPLAAFVVDIFGIGQGDWDHRRNKIVNDTAIGLAVACFYVLDFALNGLQASLRNLLLDVTPPNQLNAGNAWHGRMTNAGNIIGFGFGFLPLAELPIIRLLGGSQFRKFCVICIIILVATVWVTCWFHEEEERSAHQQRRRQGMDVLADIYRSMVTLPKPIRRVCYVQLFAFMGWFLFYSTTYVGQVMALEIGREPDHEYATRQGEFAMLIYSIVGVIAGMVLPHVATRDRRLLAARTHDSADEELNALRKMVRQWRVEAARQGKPLRLPVMPFLLRNIWTAALLFFTVLTFSTFFITTVRQATVFISLVGICWAVAMWVPFTIIMELLREPPAQQPQIVIQQGMLPPSRRPSRRPSHIRNLSTPARRPSIINPAAERQPLLRRRSYDEFDSALDEESDSGPLPGGTVLGIHNLAIVMPQFIVALATNAIFRIADGKAPVEGVPSAYYGKTGVAWVLRFGGMCTLLGAIIARGVPPTTTEKEMRRRLGEMKLLGEEPTNP